MQSELVPAIKSVRFSDVGLAMTMFGSVSSGSIFLIGTTLLLLGFLWQGQWVVKIKNFYSVSLAWAITALILVALLGSLYSDAPPDTLTRQIRVFLWLSVSFFVFAAADTPSAMRAACFSLFAGSLFTLGSSYLNVFFYLPWSITQNLGLGADHTVFYNYVIQSITMSFMASVALSFALERTNHQVVRRIAWASLFACFAFSIIHLSPGRTGFVALCCSAIVVMVRQIGFKKSVAVFSILVYIFLFHIGDSSPMWNRMAAGINDIRNFTTIQESASSWGARLGMYLLSLKFIAQAPIFGHGLGDYQTLAMSFYESASLRAISGYHPHNQYLYLGVELGSVGLLAYLWVHREIWRTATNLDSPWGSLVAAYLAVLIVASMFDAPFWMTGERHFFFPLMGLIVALTFNLRGRRSDKIPR